MIIDNESCVYITSAILVSKLNINTINDEKPYYRLQWLNECDKDRVIKQF